MPSWIYYLFHIWGISHSFLPDIVQIFFISRWNFSHEPQIHISNDIPSTSAGKPFYCFQYLHGRIARTVLLALPTASMSCILITLNNSTINLAAQARHLLYPDAKVFFKNYKLGHVALYLTLQWFLITCRITSKLLPVDGIQSLEESRLFLHMSSPFVFSCFDPSVQQCAPILNFFSMLIVKMPFLHICLFKYHLLCTSFPVPFLHFLYWFHRLYKLVSFHI